MQVIWTDRKGAGHIHSFATDEKVIAFISKLKAEAKVYDNQHKEIGRVEYNPEVADDKRVKWLWWYENQAI